MRFTGSLDLKLLKLVMVTDAHFSRHGEAKSKFSEALVVFIRNISPPLSNTARPTWNSINDRFKKLLSDHRTAVTRNLTASGIIEVRGERELLLDDIMLAVDEFDEKHR